MYDIFSDVTIKTPERLRFQLYCQLCIDFTHWSGVSITEFEQVNAGWVAMCMIPICCL